MAVNLMPGEVSDDDFSAALKLAQESIKAVGDDPVMKRDPMHVAFVGLSALLGVLAKTTRRWERATAAVVAAQSPLSEAEKVTLRAEIADGVEDGAYRAMRIESARIVRRLDHALAVRIGVACGVCLAVGALSVVGVEAITSMVQFSPTEQQRAAWASIIESNPDPRPALALAEKRADQSGRRYYANLSLWMDKSDPPPRAQ